VLVLVFIVVSGLVLTQRQAAAAKGREVLAVCAARGREAVLLVALAFLADRRQAPVKRRLKLVRLGLQVVGGRGGGEEAGVRVFLETLSKERGAYLGRSSDGREEVQGGQVLGSRAALLSRVVLARLDQLFGRLFDSAHGNVLERSHLARRHHAPKEHIVLGNCQLFAAELLLL
jgi:hypothetical protein